MLSRIFRSVAAPAMFAGLSLAVSFPAAAQTAAIVAHSARVGAVDASQRTQLAHHVPVFADTTRLSSVPIPESDTFPRLTIVMTRSAEVQAAYDQLSADLVNPSSPRFHQWLTPAQQGELYGPAQSDIDAVTSWLKSQNLTVLEVSPNRLFVDFTGSVAAVSKAFSTDFRQFQLGNGENRYSLTKEPSVPTAIAPVIGNIVGLSQTIHHVTAHHAALRSTTSGSSASPMINLNGGGHALVAGDFTNIYDMSPVYNAGYNGTGVKVAIVGESRVDANDIANLQALQAQTTKQANVIIPPGGVDPGYAGGNTYVKNGKLGDNAQDEATLDVNRVLGQAPGATADLVISGDTGSQFITQEGLYIAINYEINTLQDPILSISFGGCEGLNGSQVTAYEDGIFQTAATAGITTFVSSGDSGAAACNAFTTNANPNIPYSAYPHNSINDLCASQYVTCVGGTEFNDSNGSSTYWNTSNGSNGASAKAFIPEGAWNDISGSPGSYDEGGGGGGVSIYIAKPSFQNAVTTFPAVSAFRWVPDVAMASSPNFGFVQYEEYAGAIPSTGFYPFGGTSAAAPSMAAIQAVIESKIGTKQGNINTTLYSKGVAGSNMYHDATVASSGVTNCIVTTPSLCNNSTPSTASLTGGLPGYLLTTGWDAATGWGSLDVANYLTAVTPLTATTTTLTVTPNPANAGATVTLSASVSPSAATGTITFYNGTTAINSPASVTAGAASTTTSFATGGTYSITAVYSGDSTYASSTSAATPLVIAAPFTLSAASTTLTANALVANTDVVTITSSAPFAGTVALTLTNNLQTNIGGCSLSSASVTVASGGNAPVTLSCTPTATGSFSVTIKGTSGAVSSQVTVTGTAAAPFSVATTAIPNFASGATTGNTSTVTVTPAFGFTGTVNLGCSLTLVTGGPTTAASCAVSPTSVQNGGGTATLTITSIKTTTQAAAGGLTTAGLAGGLGLATLLMTLGGLVLPRGRRKLLLASRMVGALAFLGFGALLVTGCGSGGNTISTPKPTTTYTSAGQYLLTVTGSAASNTSVSVNSPSVTVTITQ